MRRGLSRTINAAVVIVMAIGLSGCSYNKFTTQEEAIKAQWAEVQNQLQRRNDLIPNLVESVKGFAAHEAGIFKDIADARRELLAAKTPTETIEAANQQSSALGRLLVIVENYPQLKANEQFNRLMDELVGHREPPGDRADALQRARSRSTTRSGGSSRRTSPPRCSASRNIPYCEAPAEAKQVPKVNFGR